MLFTITVAKREGGIRPGGGGAGGSQTMRAPRARRWGLEPIRGAGAGAGRRAGGRAKEERREAGLCRPPVLFPILSPIPTSTPLGICTCKEEQVPSLTLAPGCKGSVLGHPEVTRPAPTESPHSSSSPQFSPHVVASFPGLVSTEGWGAIALCLRENAGKGKGC